MRARQRSGYPHGSEAPLDQASRIARRGQHLIEPVGPDILKLTCGGRRAPSASDKSSQIP